MLADASGSVVWSGGFEPFGADWNGAGAVGLELRLPGQWSDGSWEEAGLGVEAYYNVHRWYEFETGRYSRPDPIGLHWPNGGDPFAVSSIYQYAGANSASLKDPLGLKVVIENHETMRTYEEFKKCFPLFGNIVGHFEFPSEETWSVRDPDFDPPTCNVGGRRSDKNTIWVPPDRNCAGKIKCLFHEFYELWLIRVGGFNQNGAAGPAHNRAKHGEQWIPFERCCPCDSTAGGV